MRSTHRSMTKCVRAGLSLFVLLALGACLPTSPMLGDPEKSRVDPDLNGLWVDSEEPGVVLIEPFDKRTWLITWVGFEFDDEACGTVELVDESADGAPDTASDPEPDLIADIVIEPEGETEDDYAELLEAIALHGIECFDATDEILVFKAWRTVIARQAFMTWELKGVYDEQYGYAPAEWLNLRIDKPDVDTLSLDFVNIFNDRFEPSEALEKLDEEEPPYNPRTLKAATRAAERVIRKNIDDQTLFGEAFVFHRVTPEQREFFAAILGEVWGQ